MNAPINSNPIIVYQINDRWRITEDQNPKQWMLKRMVGQRDGEARWEADGYFTTRKALIAAVRALNLEESPIAIQTLENLPKHIGRDK